jgi:hypothetical protein
MNTRKLVIVESPLSSKNGRTMEENLSYLRDCLRDSWKRGELPFASHGFFPFFLNEHDPKERQQSIEAGYQFWDFVPESLPYDNDQKPLIAFYCDWGISTGMRQALERARSLDRDHAIRHLEPNHPLSREIA